MYLIFEKIYISNFKSSYLYWTKLIISEITGYSKGYGVFSSKNMFLESSPKFQIHKVKKYDNKRVVKSFMRDYIY